MQGLLLSPQSPERADAFLPMGWEGHPGAAKMLSEQLQETAGRTELSFSGAIPDSMTEQLPQEKTWV